MWQQPDTRKLVLWGGTCMALPGQSCHAQSGGCLVGTEGGAVFRCSLDGSRSSLQAFAQVIVIMHLETLCFAQTYKLSILQQCCMVWHGSATRHGLTWHHQQCFPLRKCAAPRSSAYHTVPSALSSLPSIFELLRDMALHNSVKLSTALQTLPYMHRVEPHVLFTR